jgi:hypothetical protein
LPRAPSSRTLASTPATASKWQLGGTLGGMLGGATDMSAEHRALPETQQKLKRAGLNPATASKLALGGKMIGGVPKSDIHKLNNSQSQPTTHGEKGCNDVHFDSIRDKKKFANAADARAGGWRIVKGYKSKKTDIQSWNLITKKQFILSDIMHVRIRLPAISKRSRVLFMYMAARVCAFQRGINCGPRLKLL